MLLFEIQNLTMANKMFNSLPADVLKDINTFNLIHPIAELVKQKTVGVRRPYKKGTMTHKWSISADLSGPHPVAIGTNFIYLLVAVVTTGDEGGKTRLPYVRGLASKTGKEVATAISTIVKEMEATLGVKGIITHFHTDSGK